MASRQRSRTNQGLLGIQGKYFPIYGAVNFKVLQNMNTFSFRHMVMKVRASKHQAYGNAILDPIFQLTLLIVAQRIKQNHNILIDS
jgi:hypothetical protein